MNQCQVGNYQSSLKSNLGEPSDRNFELGYLYIYIYIYLLFWAILLSFELMEGAQQGAGDLRAREDTHLTTLGPAGTVHGRQMDARWTADGRQMDGTGDGGYMGLLDKTWQTFATPMPQSKYCGRISMISAKAIFDVDRDQSGPFLKKNLVITSYSILFM